MQARLEVCRELYTDVRLLDADTVSSIHEGTRTDPSGPDICFACRNKSAFSRHCAAKLALATKSKACRLESCGTDIAHITAHYYEVEGRPYVLELVQRTPGRTTIDPEDSEALMSEASGYGVKLYHDSLTCAFNRRYYEDVVQGFEGLFGVAIMDLDDFKIYNDSCGHQAGDLALEVTAAVIRDCIRQTDTLIRYGGDEFLLILPGCPIEKIRSKLEQIRARVQTTSVPGYPHIHLSLSIGGGMLFSCLVAGAMNTFHLIGEGSMEALNTFNGSTGFLDLYILVLITGSVLSVDRKMLIKSFAGFIPTILAGIAGALGLAGLVGAITGVGAIEAIATYAIPVMGGGNGAGITPMSKMWAAATGGDASSWYASAFAIISIGNLCAVFMSALLNKLGQIKPSMTGNGRLMVGEENVSTKSSDVKPTAADYATGLALGVVCFNVANLYAKHISIINHANLGFSIHTFAFMVILMAILNMTNILPENVKAGARGMQQFFVKYMSFPLMITVGIGTNLTDYAKVFTNPAYIVIIMATVIGAMIGTFIVGKLFHFYPVEGMLTAGLCMANGGGAGDVQCLGAAHRMELMSYAQISSRIGGAIMLVIASFVFGKFL